MTLISVDRGNCICLHPSCLCLTVFSEAVLWCWYVIGGAFFVTAINYEARYLLIYLGGMSAKEASQSEHKKILQACERKNTDGAIKLLQEHPSRAADSLAAFLCDNGQNVKNEVK